MGGPFDRSDLFMVIRKKFAGLIKDALCLYLALTSGHSLTPTTFIGAVLAAFSTRFATAIYGEHFFTSRLTRLTPKAATWEGPDGNTSDRKES